MLSIKSILTIVAFSTVSTAAAPATDNKNVLAARQGPARVFACQNGDWNEPCRVFEFASGVCFNVPGDWNDKISSIRNLNPSAFRCLWYEHGNCGGSSYDNQEDANLNDWTGGWNDRITSWRCNLRG
ncbi:hypothetical protein N656DRAFT_844295 [Canariomyces notabilis]|uniref:Beta/gamma crystallin 'Greek key' domain-containing protein n=1 Tax=Canariomyces notabilis TaxID=2074819 RepID=A0AAN6TF84_9PEZI|nr:hypothetical protein N656DRAFT_844295 [Canariomyces arenarius]